MTRIWGIIWSISKWIGTAYFVFVIGGFLVFGFIYVLYTYFWITVLVSLLIIGGIAILVRRLPDPPEDVDESDDDEEDWPVAIRVFRTVVGIIFLPITLGAVPLLFYGWGLHKACLYAWHYLNAKIPMTEHIAYGLIILALVFLIMGLNQKLGEVRNELQGIKRKL